MTKTAKTTMPMPTTDENRRRVRHCQHRKVFQDIVAHGGTATAAAMSFGATLGGSQSLNLNAAGGLVGGVAEVHR